MIILTILLLLVVFPVIGLLAVRKPINELRNTAKELIGDTENAKFLLKEAKNAADNFNAEEKSLCGMTGLMLPQIKGDFPEFDWEEYRVAVQNRVKDHIREELQGEDPVIHRTEISDYRRKAGGCTIDAQTSAGYTKDGKTVEKRFLAQITYVQDIEKMPDDAKGLGIKCPNCGAPVKMYGSKYCEYCKVGIMEINKRVWKILDVREF